MGKSIPKNDPHVRFWHKADIGLTSLNVRL
jgi:hypothetical protein